MSASVQFSPFLSLDMSYDPGPTSDVVCCVISDADMPRSVPELKAELFASPRMSATVAFSPVCRRFGSY